MQKPSEILSGAADLIETEGWCQGVYYDNFTGERCAVGAIREVSASARWDAVIEAQAKLAKVLRDNGYGESDRHPVVAHADEIVGQDFLDFALITEWNDDHRRTKDEVLRLMREAAR